MIDRNMIPKLNVQPNRGMISETPSDLRCLNAMTSSTACTKANTRLSTAAHPTSWYHDTNASAGSVRQYSCGIVSLNSQEIPTSVKDVA